MPDGGRTIDQRRSILLYYAYRSTQSAAFTVPIFILFFQARGLSFTQIGFIEATYTITVLVFETPTGYLTDRIGHRNSLLVGTVLSAVGALGYAVAQTFPTFLAVAGLRGVAGTFRSGSQSAWLYELLVGTDSEERFATISGRAAAAGITVHGVAAVLGSVMYTIDHVAPWFLEAAVIGAGLPILISMPAFVPDTAVDATNGDRTPPNDGKAISNPKPSRRRTLRTAWRTLQTPALGAFMLYTALLFGLVNTLEMFIQPMSVTVVGIPAHQLGVLYAGLTVLAAMSATRAGQIKRSVGIDGWFTHTPLVLGGVLLLVPIIPWIALPVFAIHRAIEAVSRPLAEQYINDHTPTRGRATVLSVASMVRSVVTAPLNTIGGAIAATIVLPTTIGALGALLIIGSIGIRRWRVPVIKRTSDETAVRLVPESRTGNE